MKRMQTTPSTRLPAAAAALLLACCARVGAHGDTAPGRPPGAHASHGAAQTPWGRAATTAAVQRTIDIDMLDRMRFAPERIELRQGETVRLRVRNTGQMRHELVLGTRQALAAHAAQMARTPDMAHEDAHMTHVDAGQTGEILWTFNRAGDFEFACLIAGHMQAGMVGQIRVRAARPAPAPALTPTRAAKQEAEHGSQHKH